MVEQTYGCTHRIRNQKRRSFRFYKNQLWRRLRRLWKRLGEDAPTKRREVTRGWYD